MHKITLKENPLILWRELLDLGIEFALANPNRKKNKEAALKELKMSLNRQSLQHWQGLYDTFKKLK